MDSTGSVLHSRFLRGLALSPSGTAVRIGTESMTYGDVHERALCWAGSLLAASDDPPKVIGVLASDSMTAYVGVLAALYAGAAVLPLQPTFPVTRLRGMLAAAGTSALIADRRGAGLLPELLGSGRDVLVLTPDRDAGAEAPRQRSVPPGPRHALTRPRPTIAADIAYILYTSGSTGRPKGVPITHGSADHYFGLIDRRYDFVRTDVFSQAFDLTFDCAMFDLFCAWGAGATAVRVPTAAYRDLPAFCAQHRLTVWFSTPNAISLVRRLGDLRPDALPGLRWSLFAGEALRCADAAAWARAATGSLVENLYGPTETTITITAHRWSDKESAELGVNGVVPIGFLHEGHDFRLLDAGGRPADGEGELFVAGPQLATGYLDRRDDAGRFVPRDGELWYRTGDLVRRLPNGEFAYLGRTDGQIQLNGWRVEPAEIDHAVRQCVGVDDAVTVSASVGEATELVVYYTGRSTPAAELAHRLRQVLPPGLIPRHYLHVTEFPLNANRKTDRSLLCARAADLLAALAR